MFLTFIAGPSLGFENCGCGFPSLHKESMAFSENEGFKVDFPQNLWVQMQPLKKSVGADYPLHPH